MLLLLLWSIWVWVWAGKTTVFFSISRCTCYGCPPMLPWQLTVKQKQPETRSLKKGLAPAGEVGVHTSLSAGETQRGDCRTGAREGHPPQELFEGTPTVGDLQEGPDTRGHSMPRGERAERRERRERRLCVSLRVQR